MAEGAPRFRRDLPASNVEADGVLYVEVSDPRSGKSFRFYDFEYAVALKMDGRPLDKVADDLRAEELELTVEQLEGFADQLRSLGFVEESPGFFPPLAEDESGEWAAPPIRASVAPAAPPAQEMAEDPTPGPPPSMEEVNDSFKPSSPSARSLSEHTFTSYPPEDKPDSWPKPADGGVRSTPGPVGLTPTPVPSPFPPARYEAPGSAEETVADMRQPTPEELEPEQSAGVMSAALRNATDNLQDLSNDLGDDLAEEETGRALIGRTPSGGNEARTAGSTPSYSDDTVTPPSSVAVPNGVAMPAASVPSSDRRELPTQRLRAVGEGAAEVPGEPFGMPSGLPSGMPGGLPPAADPLSQPPRALSPAAGVPRVPGESPAMRPMDVGRRPAWMAYAVLGVLAAIIIAVVVYKFQVASEPPPLTVRALVPSPTTVYRWWDATGTVERAEGTAFAFASAGKVAEIAAAGSRFNVGDVIGLLESGKRFRAEVSHNKERLAYYEQMRESMERENNRPEVRQAEIKIAEKKRLIAEAEGNLAKHSIVALQSGEVAESLVAAGGQVKEGEPALRVKGSTYRASFELSKEDAEKARQLGFCRVEIEGKPIDCSLSAEGGDETHVVIDLPSDPLVAAGKTVKLARNRLDAVFPLPASAVERVGDTDRLFVVVGSRAELRVISVEDRNPTEVVVSQGLDVGDRVILDRPPGLKQDARVLISETIAR